MSHSSKSETLYTTGEAAEILGVTRRQVLRLCKEGRIRSFQGDPTNSKSPWLIPQSSIDEIMRLREAQANR